MKKNQNEILYLWSEELLDVNFTEDEEKLIIKVDKQIYDDFKENSIIKICLDDYDDDFDPVDFLMVSEDAEGIYMECSLIHGGK